MLEDLNVLQTYLVTFCISALIGSFNWAGLISRLRGVDIRSVGSSNPGAANVFLYVGRISGLLVMVLDMLKTMLAIAVCQKLFGRSLVLRTLAGSGACIGHMYPFYRLFRKGGKGLACLCVTIFVTEYHCAMLLIIALGVMVKLTGHFALVPLVGCLVIPPLFGYCTHDYRVFFILLVTCLLMLNKHRENLKWMLDDQDMVDKLNELAKNTD